MNIYSGSLTVYNTLYLYFVRTSVPICAHVMVCFAGQFLHIISIVNGEHSRVCVCEYNKTVLLNVSE